LGFAAFGAERCTSTRGAGAPSLRWRRDVQTNDAVTSSLAPRLLVTLLGQSLAKRPRVRNIVNLLKAL
jgi:hypothetical protein